jgi:pyruvate dehydrogenase phosphatase
MLESPYIFLFPL